MAQELNFWNYCKFLEDQDTQDRSPQSSFLERYRLVLEALASLLLLVLDKAQNCLRVVVLSCHCPVLSYLVEPCLVFIVIALSCLVLSCPVLSCLVLTWLVLSCDSLVLQLSVSVSVIFL